MPAIEQAWVDVAVGGRVDVTGTTSAISCARHLEQVRPLLVATRAKPSALSVFPQLVLPAAHPTEPMSTSGLPSGISESVAVAVDVPELVE